MGRETNDGALPDRPEPALTAEVIEAAVLAEFPHLAMTERPLRSCFERIAARLSQPPVPATAHEVKR